MTFDKHGRRFGMACVSIAVLTSVAMAGCAGDQPSPDGTAQAVAYITSVPSAVNCIEIHTMSSVPVTQRFDVTPGASAVLHLTGLAIGLETFTGEAYAAPCVSVDTNSAASWVAVPLSTTLEQGVIAALTLQFVPASGAALTIDFNADAAVAGSDASVTDAPGCDLPLSLCGTTCVNLQTDAANCGACGVTCSPTTPCIAGSCASGVEMAPSCASGFTLCGNTCVNLATNAANCGSCGNACSGTSHCQGASVCGIDSLSCDNATFCGGVCVDVSSDVSNCGACGVGCRVGQACTNGACM